MKRCPECGREYDNSMVFCLDDGAELLYGPASMDEPQTAIFHDTDSAKEAATRAFSHITEGEDQQPENAVTLSDKHSFSAPLTAKPMLAVLALSVIIIGGFFGYRYFSTANVGTISSIAVLPFENFSGDPDSEYLSDGLARRKSGKTDHGYWPAGHSGTRILARRKTDCDSPSSTG